MKIFLNALDALIPFSFFPDFWVWVTSEARGSVSVGFWGSCQLSPFFWGGGSCRRALSTPPPRNENPASHVKRSHEKKQRTEHKSPWASASKAWYLGLREGTEGGY